jgi:hypothetical protein
MIKAPITVPMGETIPPEKEPPPTMTAAIDSKVYCVPTFASPVVFSPAKERPAKIAKIAASA